MKKRIFFSLVLLAALLLSGCGSVVRGSGDVIREDRQIDGFSKVTFSGIGEVLLVQGDEENLVIEAEDNLLRYLTSEVRDDTLGLGIQSWNVNLRPSRPVVYHLTVKDISALRVSGSGDIRAEYLTAEALGLKISGSGQINIETLEVGTLETTISGSGDIYLEHLAAELVTARISGSGECYVSGESLAQRIDIHGSGKYYASELESETVSAKISGSGDAWVSATENLEVRIFGSGDIHYYGRPSVNQHISGSGDIVSLSGTQN